MCRCGTPSEVLASRACGSQPVAVARSCRMTLSFRVLVGRAAQDGSCPQTQMTLNEAQTRVRLIDPQLRAADWKLNDRTQVRFEVPVDGYDAEPWNGVTDYCLYEPSGNVLAVVEAKRCSRKPR